MVTEGRRSVVTAVGEQRPGDRAEPRPGPGHIAGNDWALGQVVDTVSHSKYWANTAIFVTEDDAQDGPDHTAAKPAQNLNEVNPVDARTLLSLSSKLLVCVIPSS